MILNSKHVKITGQDVAVMLPTGAELLEVYFSEASFGLVFVYKGPAIPEFEYVRRYRLVKVEETIPESGIFLRYFQAGSFALYEVTNHKDSILKEVTETLDKSGIKYEINQNALITPYGQYDLFSGKFQVGDYRGIGIHAFLNCNRNCISQGTENERTA